jgi:hypothetical protein
MSNTPRGRPAPPQNADDGLLLAVMHPNGGKVAGVAVIDRPAFIIHKPVFAPCEQCSPAFPTRGYVVEIAGGGTKTLCVSHVGALLLGCCRPPA